MKEKCKLCWKSNENDTNVFFWFKYQSGLALGQSFQFIWKIWAKFKNSIDPCHHRTWLIWIKLLQAWSTANTQNIFRWKSQLIYSNFTLNKYFWGQFPHNFTLYTSNYDKSWLYCCLEQWISPQRPCLPSLLPFFHFLVFSILVLLKKKSRLSIQIRFVGFLFWSISFNALCIFKAFSCKTLS